MKPIIGIGELLWDVFPDGRKVAGGAPFNFAFHCQQLGHKAVIVSRVGNDLLGQELREEVIRLGLTDEFIQTDPAHPTGTVQVSVNNQGQPSYTIVENVAWDFLEWTDQVEMLQTLGGPVCYGSLAMRSPVSRSTIQQFVSGKSEITVFDINLRNTGFQVTEDTVAEAHWLKMNIDELMQIGNWCGDVEKTVRDVFTNPLVIVTQGEAGSHVISRTETVHVPGITVDVVDTVGAGDAFTAALLCLHREGKPLETCVRFATRYAAEVCRHQGATPRIDRGGLENGA